MSMSVKLNELVTLMAKEKGYAYTAGYLQSLVMELSYGLRSKSLQDRVVSDLEYQISLLEKPSTV
jgi:hypothetical protein